MMSVAVVLCSLHGMFAGGQEYSGKSWTMMANSGPVQETDFVFLPKNGVVITGTYRDSTDYAPPFYKWMAVLGVMFLLVILIACCGVFCLFKKRKRSNSTSNLLHGPSAENSTRIRITISPPESPPPDYTSVSAPLEAGVKVVETPPPRYSTVVPPLWTDGPQTQQIP